MERPGRATEPRLRPLRAQIPERKARPDYFQWRVVAVVLGLAVMGFYSWMWLIAGEPVGSALVAIPLVVLLSTPIFVLASRTVTTFDLGGLLALGLVLRLAAAYYRFTNAADGLTYHLAGAELAKSYRGLTFPDPGSPVPGTGGMKILTGIAEVLTNSNAFATFVVFTWLGFLGCYFFFRAFATALPKADLRRYALLIFLWPTLVFWPSSIGKDCWMVFTIGIAALGAARVLARRPGGYVLLAVGLVMGSFVRPHVALLFVVAFGAALLVGRRAHKAGALTPSGVAKAAGLVVLLVLGAVMASRTSSFLQANDINSTQGLVFDLSQRTGQGGSAFTAPDPQNPVGYVVAVVTVLFRPFLFEASGTDMIVTSIEALFLLGLFAASWRRLLSIPRRLRSDPYLLLALAFIGIFVFLFGTISNFGILARERSVMMPFVFVLLSVNLPEPRLRKPAAKGRSSPRQAPTRPR